MAKTTVRSLLLPLVGFSDLQYPGSYAMAPKSNSGGWERKLSCRGSSCSYEWSRSCRSDLAMYEGGGSSQGTLGGGVSKDEAVVWAGMTTSA